MLITFCMQGMASGTCLHAIWVLIVTAGFSSTCHLLWNEKSILTSLSNAKEYVVSSNYGLMERVGQNYGVQIRMK